MVHPSSFRRHSPLPASQSLTVPPTSADASLVESWEKATDVTRQLWPSRVFKQALHPSPITGLIVIHVGASFLKRPLIRLQVGLKISADI